MNTKENTTLNEALTSTDFRKQMGIDLSNMSEVIDSIKSAIDLGKIDSLNDISSFISQEKLATMISNQTNALKCTMASLGGIAPLGTENINNTLNTALSTVLTSISCNFASMQQNLSKIGELTKKIENIKSTLKNGNMDELKKISE